MPLVHNQNAIAHGNGFVLVVGDQNKGRVGFFLQFAEFHLKFFAQVGVQSGEGFVQKENLRFVHQGARQGRPLLLPAGKSRGHFFGEVGDIDEFQHGIDASLDFILGNLLAFEPERHVSENVQVRKKRIILENRIDGTFGRGSIRNDLPVQKHFAGVRFFKTADNAEKRRLSTARRTEKRHELSVLDIDVDAFENGFGTETFIDAANLQIGARQRIHGISDEVCEKIRNSIVSLER